MLLLPTGDGGRKVEQRLAARHVHEVTHLVYGVGLALRIVPLVQLPPCLRPIVLSELHKGKRVIGGMKCQEVVQDIRGRLLEPPINRHVQWINLFVLGLDPLEKLLEPRPARIAVGSHLLRPRPVRLGPVGTAMEYLRRHRLDVHEAVHRRVAIAATAANA